MGRISGIVGSLALLALAEPSFGQGLTDDAARGGQIAEDWCSTCHVVSDRQDRGTTDAPTFRSIAERSPEAIDALEAFLMDTHPPMPDFNLTRNEIRNLLVYIASLREH